MPTLFEQLEGSLQGSDLSGQLVLQVDSLSSITQAITALSQNPPTSLETLSQAITELPLPSLESGGELATTLSQIQSALPTDLSDLTGDLIAGLESLGNTIDSDITQVLQQSLNAVLAVYRLTQIDFRCQTASTFSLTAIAQQRGADLIESNSDIDSRDRALTPLPAGIAAVIAQIDAVQTVLDRAPDPLDVGTFLDWLHRGTDFPIRSKVLPQPLPIFDDLREPLDTLLTWKSMNPAQIQTHLIASLQSLSVFIRSTVDFLFSTLLTDLAATATALNTDRLGQIADDLTATLNQLRTAVSGGNLSDTDAAIAQLNTRLDEYAVLKAAMQSVLLDKLPDVSDRLATLPDDLADQMSHLISALQPNGALGLLQEIASAEVDAGAVVQTEVQQRLQPLLDWVENLTRQLDLTAIKQPLQQVAETARSAVDGLEGFLTDVTIQVRSLFAQVESLLQQVDIQAIVDQVKDAIGEFAVQLTQQIVSLFQPVRSAITQIVQTIGSTIDQFDPEAIIAALRQVIQAITSVFQDPSVVAALTQIRKAIETATTQLKDLSFTPLTDQVVTAIEDVTNALKLIDPSLLDTALKLSLQAALAVLPEDLTPITNPILDEFGTLVEQGPVPLLETVKAQPQKLLDQVNSLQPAALLGDTLSRPFQDLLKQMEAFQPTQLLHPVSGELDKLKDRLKQDANPATALRQLEAPFQELLQAFDRLQPDALVQPLEAAIQDAIDQILTVLPVDEIFAEVDRALASVAGIVTLGQHTVSLIETLRSLLDGFAGSQPQIESWITAILDKVAAVDTAALQPQFTALTSALDDTKAAPLGDRFNQIVNPLLVTLTAMQPQERLRALVQSYASFPRSALVALPNSPQKTAMLAAIDRFNPLEPSFNAPYRAIAAYRQTLAEAQSSLQTALTDWDSRYHRADGILSGFSLSSATPANLRQWVQDALQPQFTQPLKAFFTLIEPLQGSLGAILTLFKNLITSLQSQIADLVLGPDSLGGIRDTLEQLVQRLRDFNLGFLRDSLQDLFAELRDKLTALDPAQLKQAIETAFDQMLQTLSLDLMLPPADLTRLDQDYAALIEKLKPLDPEQLVIQVIQPEFEQKVLPLLKTFDLTDLFTALIDRLRSLDDELKAEMDRVNAAYHELRQAIPSISVDISIGGGISL